MEPHFEHYFGKTDDGLRGHVVFYHLNLETLLEKVLKFHLKEPSVLGFDRMMFAQKNNLCCAIGAINQDIHSLLKDLNKFRNKIAHSFGYQPTFEEIFELTTKAASAGVDFSDGIGGDIEWAKELNYNEEGLLNSTFRNTFYHVATDQPESFYEEFVC